MKKENTGKTEKTESQVSSSAKKTRFFFLLFRQEPASSSSSSAKKPASSSSSSAKKPASYSSSSSKKPASSAPSASSKPSNGGHDYPEEQWLRDRYQQGCRRHHPCAPERQPHQVKVLVYFNGSSKYISTPSPPTTPGRPSPCSREAVHTRCVS